MLVKAMSPIVIAILSTRVPERPEMCNSFAVVYFGLLSHNGNTVQPKTLKKAFPFIWTSFERPFSLQVPPKETSTSDQLPGFPFANNHFSLPSLPAQLLFLFRMSEQDQEFKYLMDPHSENDAEMTDQESDAEPEVSTVLGGAGRMSDDVVLQT